MTGLMGRVTGSGESRPAAAERPGSTTRGHGEGRAGPILGHTAPVDQSALLITSDSGAGYDVLRLSGELDVFSNTMLRGMVQDEPLLHDVLVLDLGAITFMDSSGIASLVFSMRNAADRDAELVLVADTPHIVRLIRMAGLHKIVRVHPTEAAYCAEVHGSDVAG